MQRVLCRGFLISEGLYVLYYPSLMVLLLSAVSHLSSALPSVALSVWLPGHLVKVPQTTFCIQNTAMLIIFQSRSMERNNHIVSERNHKTSIHVVCNMLCCIQVYTCTHVHEIVACTGWDSKPHLQSSSLAHYELSYRGSSVLDGQNPRQRLIIGKATLKTLLCTIRASAFPLHTHARKNGLIFPCRCVKGEDLGTRLVQSYYYTDALKHTEGLEIVFSSLPPVSLVPNEAYQSLQP